MKLSIKNLLTGGITSINNLFKGFMAYKKMEKIAYARVIYADAHKKMHGITEKDVIYADVDIDKDWLRIKGIDRIFFLEGMYYDANGQPVVIISDGYHSSLDLSKYREYQQMLVKYYEDGKTKEIKEAITSEELESAQMFANIKAQLKLLGIKDINTCYNLNAFDNALSKDLCNKAEKIMSNNMFRLLDDIPNRMIIALLVIGFLSGGLFCFGFVFITEVILAILRAMQNG